MQTDLRVAIPERRIVRAALKVALRLRLIEPETAIRAYTNAMWRKARFSVGGGRWRNLRRALA